MILLFILVFVAGVAKAVMDTLQFHFVSSIFYRGKDDQFWMPSISWKNKYKNGNKEDGESFWGSTTIFISFTDGWHLFQAIFLVSIFLAVIFYVPILTYSEIPVLGKIFDYCILRGIFGLAFTLFYDKLLKK